MHISSAESGYDAIGGSIAGMPGVRMLSMRLHVVISPTPFPCSVVCCRQIFIGRNQYFAWGQSSTGLDQQDLFSIPAVDENVYVYNNSQVLPFTRRQYSIGVKVCNAGG